MATFNGTAGNNTLRGTADGDQFSGMGGNDLIYGYAGDDLFLSAPGGISDPGRSTIWGGDGMDRITADGGDDVYDGGSGIDTLNFYDFSDFPAKTTVDLRRTDTQSTGWGLDRITGIENLTASVGSANVWFAGTTSANRLESYGDGSDTMHGYGGDDYIRGSNGNDHLLGEDGNDELRAEGTGNRFYGGAGNDEIIISDPSMGNQIYGSSGTDTLSYVDLNGVIDLSQPAAGADTISGIEFLEFRSSSVTFRGTANAEIVRIYQSDANVASYGGDDDFSISYSSGRLDTGIGNDTVDLGYSAMAVFGGDGNDSFDMHRLTGTGQVIDSGAGNDVIDIYATGYEGATDQRISGGAGNDDINVSWSQDWVQVGGDDGNDVISVAGFASSKSSAGRVDGGAGDDTITSSFRSSGTTTGIGFELLGGFGNDSVSGTDFSDTMNGGAGNDTLIGGAGADILIGGDGLDWAIYDGNEGVTVNMANPALSTGEASGDRFTGIEGLIGTWEADILIGDSRNNGLRGMYGDDTLTGGVGNDSLDGGRGYDRLLGGKGNDIYVLDRETDIIVEAAGEGTDLVRSFIDYTLAANVENLLLLGAAALSGTGNGLANRINGNAGHNRLSGLEGQDTLNGGAGNDLIDGGAGNDRLTGGEGNDSVIGGAGADLLTGGTGADRFVFIGKSQSTVAVSGQDTITDFNRAQGDLIDLSAMDANLLQAGNQSFHFVGNAAFSGKAGELAARAVAGGTMISGDMNGDKIGDFKILLDDRLTLNADSFIL